MSCITLSVRVLLHYLSSYYIITHSVLHFKSRYYIISQTYYIMSWVTTLSVRVLLYYQLNYYVISPSFITLYVELPYYKSDLIRLYITLEFITL